jgi:hypothetical protein
MERHLAGIVAALVTAIAVMAVLLILLPALRQNSEVLAAGLLLSLSIASLFLLPALVDRLGSHPATDAGKIGGIGLAAAAVCVLLVLAGCAIGFALAALPNFVWASVTVWLAVAIVSVFGLRSSTQKVAAIAASSDQRSDRSVWLDMLAEASSVASEAPAQKDLHDVAETIRYSATDIPGKQPFPVNQAISTEVAALLSACRETQPDSAVIHHSCSRLQSLLSQRHSQLLQARTRN